jgi:hypothetical protein
MRDPATCTTHGGPTGYTNLLVSKRNGSVELDPHVTGFCVIRLDEHGARTLCEALVECSADRMGD